MRDAGERVMCLGGGGVGGGWVVDIRGGREKGLSVDRQRRSREKSVFAFSLLLRATCAHAHTPTHTDTRTHRHTHTHRDPRVRDPSLLSRRSMCE